MSNIFKFPLYPDTWIFENNANQVRMMPTYAALALRFSSSQNMPDYGNEPLCFSGKAYMYKMI